MAKTTKRRFTDEFKREAVALWKTSSRLQTEVASDLGIMPTMLRRGRRKLQGGDVFAGPIVKPLASPMASSADQASEIAPLRREFDRARMERDIPRHLCGDAAMTFAFIERHASARPVNVMRRVTKDEIVGRVGASQRSCAG